MELSLFLNNQLFLLLHKTQAQESQISRKKERRALKPLVE